MRLQCLFVYSMNNKNRNFEVGKIYHQSAFVCTEKSPKTLGKAVGVDKFLVLEIDKNFLSYSLTVKILSLPKLEILYLIYV